MYSWEPKNFQIPVSYISQRSESLHTCIILNGFDKQTLTPIII